MQPNHIEQSIIDKCLDQNGFLVLLHSKAILDKQKYKELIDDISKYADALGTDRQLNRSVATCLIELMTAISTSLEEFVQKQHPDLPELQKAHAEVSTLLHEKIFVFNKDY